MNITKPRQYKRLETDSSEEDLDPTNKVKKSSKTSQNLQLELEKKEEEIENLKKILMQTQEKLQTSLLNSSYPETSLKDSSLDCLAETVPRQKKKFVEKFEDLVFVSKKNNLLLDEFDEVGLSRQEDLVKVENLVKIQDFPKTTEKNSNENPSSPERSLDGNIDKTLNSSKDVNESRSVEKNNFFVMSPKASEISKSPSEKSKIFYKNLEKLEIIGSDHSFADFPTPRNEPQSLESIRCTPTLKNSAITENSEKPGKITEKVKSFDDLDSFLSNSYEDSQSKLKKILPSSKNSPHAHPDSIFTPAKILKSPKLHKEQATNTDLNDISQDILDAAILESKIEKFGIELRGSSSLIEKSINTRSRNSSFPWIQPQKLEDPEPLNIENLIEVQDIPPQIPKRQKKARKTSNEKVDPQKQPKKPPKPRRFSEKAEKSKSAERKNQTLPVNKRTDSAGRNPKAANQDKTFRPSSSMNPHKSSKQPHPASQLSHKSNRSGNSNNSKKSRKQKSSKPAKRKLSSLKGINESTLDEIIFDQDHDMVSWHSLMHKFRRNPEVVEKLMKVNIRPVTRESTLRPKSSSRGSRDPSRVTSNANPSTSNTLTEYRPISASTISKKVKDPDWSFSVLSNYVSQDKKKFNFFHDPSVLSVQEIEEFLVIAESREFNIKDLKKLFGRILKTLNVLKNDLLLPEFWIVMPSFSEDSVIQGLHKCAKLIKARNLTVKIIDLIQKRERVLSNVIISKNLTNLKELEKINEELMQVLVFWRYMELPFSNFIYMGEDYYVKIQTDNISVSAIFPEFNVDNIYRPPHVSDSFNFDI